MQRISLPEYRIVSETGRGSKGMDNVEDKIE